MNQLAMMGLVPSTATPSLGLWHSAWPLVLLLIVLMAVLPMAQVFSRNRGQPGD